MRDLAHAKTEYDKFAEALAQLEETGYGIVTPRLEDISFNEPEIVRRGGQFGIKLQAERAVDPHGPGQHRHRSDALCRHRKTR